MLKIKLNKNEHSYLSQASFIPKKIQISLFSEDSLVDEYLVTISEEQAEEIRDLCGERLQLVGFDEKYKPTTEGKILEALIDKFFSA